MTGIVLVVAGSTMAVTGPGFSINGGAEIQILPGGHAWVPVTAVVPPGTPMAIYGMNLYLATQAPFTIDSLILDTPGSGTFWDGNSTGANVFTHVSHSFVPPEYAVGYVTVPADPVPIADGVTVGILKVVAPAGMGFGTTGTLSTILPPPYGPRPSDWADRPAASQGLAALHQGLATLRVMPEPGGVMLMAAALALTQRRRIRSSRR
ncbi:MAG: hypothetical protein HY718_15335 [Planctomycetes bacterium]|nr:hypothetical protein [Planctomycetota bacterium]